MPIPKDCTHPNLRALNKGLCPICDTNPFRPGAPVRLTMTAHMTTDGGEAWRAHARNVLGPLVARLPDQLHANPAVRTKESVYCGPPVGCRAAVVEVGRRAVAQLTHTEVVAERCRRSLAYFVRAYWPVMSPGITLHWNWHLEAICHHVQSLLEDWMRKQLDPSYTQRVQNLAINCPPRSLKSTIVSVCAPAWMWLRWPAWKSIFVSSNPKVSSRDSRQARACIESPWYQEIKSAIVAALPEGDERDRMNWQLEGSGDLAYSNTSGGRRESMSFKSMVTGLGGDAIFVDDPNDPKRALSERERANVIDQWDIALCNRVQDFMSSVRILIMQRVHEMDLTGHWQCSMPRETTFYLAIPNDFDPELDAVNRTSPYGYHDPRTKEGELLHPARLSGVALAGERAKLSYPGQYNQRPQPLEGGCFKRAAWNFFYISSGDHQHHPMTGSLVDREMTVDPIETDGATVEMREVPKDGALRWQPTDGQRDPAAHGRPRGCDTTRPSRILPFLDRLVISVDASFGSKKETASRVSIGVIGIKGADHFIIDNRTRVRSVPETKAAIEQIVRDFPAASWKLVERKAAGHDVVESMRSRVSGMIPIDDNSNWMDRAMGMLPSVVSGNWYILEGAQWATSTVAEFAMFPNGTHDDQIDMCSQVHKYAFPSTGGNKGTLGVGW